MLILNDKCKIRDDENVSEVIYNFIKDELTIWNIIDKNNILIKNSIDKLYNGNEVINEVSIVMGEHVLKIKKGSISGTIIQEYNLIFEVYLIFDSIKKKVSLLTNSIKINIIN